MADAPGEARRERAGRGLGDQQRRGRVLVAPDRQPEGGVRGGPAGVQRHPRAPTRVRAEAGRARAVVGADDLARAPHARPAEDGASLNLRRSGRPRLAPRDLTDPGRGRDGGEAVSARAAQPPGAARGDRSGQRVLVRDLPPPAALLRAVPHPAWHRAADRADPRIGAARAAHQRGDRRGRRSRPLARAGRRPASGCGGARGRRAGRGHAPARHAANYRPARCGRLPRAAALLGGAPRGGARRGARRAHARGPGRPDPQPRPDARRAGQRNRITRGEARAPDERAPQTPGEDPRTCA